MEKDSVVKKHIEITRKQFAALLKAVYLGNVMANTYRDGGPLDPLMDEYEEALHFIFGQASRFGLEKYAHQETEEEDVYHPTRLFEEGTDVRKMLDAYDDAVFWDELAERLGERDFHAAHTEETATGMSEEEYAHQHHKSIDRYEDEFADHGIDRLRIAEEREKSS